MTVGRMKGIAARVLCGAALALLTFEGTARLGSALEFGSDVHVEKGAVHAAGELVEDFAQGRRTGDPDALRILAVGDSISAALGVPEGDRWWDVAAQDLEQATGRRVEILNASFAGTNLWQQEGLIASLLPTFRPHLVLVVFNYDDIRGSHQRTVEPVAPKSKSATAGWRGSLFGVGKALGRLNDQLRAHGVVLPGTAFYAVTKELYLPGTDARRDLTEEITRVHRLTEGEGAALAFYVVPAFNHLQRDLFTIPRGAMKELLSEQGIPHRFGWERFAGASPDVYAISTLDAHPNRKANREMGADIAAALRPLAARVRTASVAVP